MCTTWISIVFFFIKERWMKSHISYIFFVPTCRALPLLGILLVVGICYTGYKVPVVGPFGFECVYMNVALGFALIWHRFATVA